MHCVRRRTPHAMHHMVAGETTVGKLKVFFLLSLMTMVGLLLPHGAGVTGLTHTISQYTTFAARLTTLGKRPTGPTTEIGSNLCRLSRTVTPAPKPQITTMLTTRRWIQLSLHSHLHDKAKLSSGPTVETRKSGDAIPRNLLVRSAALHARKVDAAKAVANDPRISLLLLKSKAS